MPGRSLLDRFTGQALIDPCDLDAVVHHGLYGFGRLLDLAAILAAGRRAMEGEQMPQRIAPDMQPGTLLAFGCIAASFVAFWRRARFPAVDDRCAWLGLAARRRTQHYPQIVDHRFDAVGSPASYSPTP
jgi:hypothetical protein